jgi:hypothetical protein
MSELEPCFQISYLKNGHINGLAFEVIKKYIGKFYTLEDYVDTTCQPEIREKVISYLSQAPIALAGQIPQRRCGLCDDLVYPASYRSDGTWLWPDHLSHDVEKHNFCIPNAMVKDILEPGLFHSPERLSMHHSLVFWT